MAVGVVGSHSTAVSTKYLCATYLTTLGWFSSFSKDISLIAVLGTPSDSLKKSRTYSQLTSKQSKF